MEKRNPTTGLGILRFDSVPFGAVAQGTGQGQIVQLGLTPFDQGADMIYVKRRHREILTAQAIFATPVCSLNHLPPERWR